MASHSSFIRLILFHFVRRTSIERPKNISLGGPENCHRTGHSGSWFIFRMTKRKQSLHETSPKLSANISLVVQLSFRATSTSCFELVVDPSLSVWQFSSRVCLQQIWCLDFLAMRR